MQALTYHGSRDERVEAVADATPVQPDDLLLRVTATVICSSDMHLHRGKVQDFRHNDIRRPMAP